MNRSESITQLATALAKAQGQFSAATKSRTNPHLKNTYATLDDIIDAVRAPLAANALSFVQPLGMDDGGGFQLETLVLHESGEWIGTTVSVSAMTGNRGVNELQAFGGALTYMRRYALTSLLGINTEEDNDGNGKPKQAHRDKAAEPVTETPKPEPGPFNPEMPAVEVWAELHDAAVRQLHYNHPNHVKHTLKQVFSGQAGELTFEAAWKALVQHQQSKDAPVDAQQAEDELFGEPVPA